MLDEHWIRSLHVATMRERDLDAEREHHVLFQASTIGALLDGAYDGDLTFAELAEHGVASLRAWPEGRDQAAYARAFMVLAGSSATIAEIPGAPAIATGRNVSAEIGRWLARTGLIDLER